MVKSKKNIRLILSLLVLSFFSMIYLGCAQAVPNLTTTNSSVVFSYPDNDSLPAARLSVFAQSRCDVRRCQRIKIRSLETNFVWETTDLKKIATGDYMWAGNVNFTVPDSFKIPTGRYELTYYNADEEQDISYFNVNYDKKLYDLKSEDISEVLQDKANLKIAIYDNNKILIYFGDLTENYDSDEKILNNYNSAEYLQNVWISYDSSVICILPERKLVAEAEDQQ